jgi:hypothetical protein
MWGGFAYYKLKTSNFKYHTSFESVTYSNPEIKEMNVPDSRTLAAKSAYKNEANPMMALIHEETCHYLQVSRFDKFEDSIIAMNPGLDTPTQFGQKHWLNFTMRREVKVVADFKTSRVNMAALRESDNANHSNIQHATAAAIAVERNSQTINHSTSELSDRRAVINYYRALVAARSVEADPFGFSL